MSGQKNDPKNEKAKSTFTEKRLHDSMREVLSSPSGRVVIWDILGMGGIHSVTFTGNAQGSFLEGKRALSLQVEALVMESDPDALILMMQESRKREGSNG